MSDTQPEKSRRTRCKNWLRGAMALRFVRNGMQKFIEEQIHRHYKEMINKLKSTHVPAASSCKACTKDNLLPYHAIRKSCFRRHCFCNIQKSNRRPCPLNLCDRLYDEIVNSHSLNSPIWINTNPSRWFEDEWEIAKCFLGSQGYFDKQSAKDTDLAGLLSIAINNTFVHNNMDNSIEEVNEIRDIRNFILHSASQELEDHEVICYIGKMISFLNDKKAFADNEDTESATNSLQRLIDDRHCNITLTEELDLKEEASKNLEEFLRRQQSDQNQKEEERILAKKRIKEGIISFYQKSCSTTDVSPFLPELEVAVDKIYAPPLLLLQGLPSVHHCSVSSYYNLNRSKQTDRNNHTIGVSDFLSLENISNKTILVLGEAGVGKTSFCLNIMSDWCKFQSAMQEKNSEVAQQSFLNKDYVFFIQLKYCQDCDFIEEMIRKMLVDELYHKTLMDILQFESERCLVILDGLENWTQQNTDCARGQSECFPRRELKSPLTVIYTSRPWKLASVRPRSSEIDMTIELCGIVDSALECFVDRVLKHLETSFGRKKPGSSKACLQLMRHRNLSNLMNSPLFLKFLICLWFDQRVEDMSYSGIYTAIVDTLLEKLSPSVVGPPTKTIPHFAGDIVKRFPRAFTFLYSIDNYILPLAVFAFNLCIKEGKRYFHKYHDSDLEAFGLDKTTFQDLQTTGILSERIVYTPSATRKCTEVSFVHDSFIEYFAAIHLSLIPMRISKLALTGEGILDKSLLFQFLSGIGTVSVSDISKGLMAVVDADENVTDYRNQNSEYTGFIIEIQKLITTCLQEAAHCSLQTETVQLRDVIINEHIDVSFEELRQIDPRGVRSLFCNTCLAHPYQTPLCQMDNLELLVFQQKKSGRIVKMDMLERCILSNRYTLKCLVLNGLDLRDIVVLEKIEFCHLNKLTISHCVVSYDQVKNLLTSSLNIFEVTLRDVVCKNINARLDSNSESSQSKWRIRLNIRKLYIIRCQFDADDLVILLNDITKEKGHPEIIVKNIELHMSNESNVLNILERLKNVCSEFREYDAIIIANV